MTDFFFAKDPVISLLRVAAFIVAVLLPILLIRTEVRGLARRRGDWIRDQARLSRTKTGYVAALLGRSSTLLGGCTFVFAVFRTDYFANPGAQAVAMILSAVAIVAGCFIGLIVVAITHEIMRQTRADD